MDPFPQAIAAIKFYDFRDDNDVANVWTQFKDDEGSTVGALLDRKGGGITFDTGSFDGGSYNILETDNYTFAFEEGKATWAKFRISSFDTEGAVSYSTMGFGDGWINDPAEPFIDKPNNYFELNIINGDYIFIGTGPAGDGDDIAASLDIKDEEYHDIGMHFEPTESASGTHDLYIFVDNEYVGSQIGLTMPTAPVTRRTNADLLHVSTKRMGDTFIRVNAKPLHPADAVSKNTGKAVASWESGLR
jgi:hypothetical protein